VAPDGVDIVVEVSPAHNAELNARIIANHGTIAVYATEGGAEMMLDVRHHFALNVRYQFLLLYTVGSEALTAAAEDMGRALTDGSLDVGEEAGLPLTRFPLERTADAHDAVQAGAVGKVLIDVAARGCPGRRPGHPLICYPTANQPARNTGARPSTASRHQSATARATSAASRSDVSITVIRHASSAVRPTQRSHCMSGQAFVVTASGTYDGSTAW
jgi:hypothetical protein